MFLLVASAGMAFDDRKPENSRQAPDTVEALAAQKEN